jgi:hypothetical protein
VPHGVASLGLPGAAFPTLFRLQRAQQLQH